MMKDQIEFLQGEIAQRTDTNECLLTITDEVINLKKQN